MEHQGDLRRVTFRFGQHTQVHYLSTLPKPGDVVSHGGELWRVARVEEDVVGTLVVCEPGRADHADA
jgi:hypothetical protein